MGAQGVTNTGQFLNRQPSIPQDIEVVCQAIGDTLDVVYGGNVAGRLTQSTPIHHEQIEAALFNVGCLGL